MRLFLLTCAVLAMMAVPCVAQPFSVFWSENGNFVNPATLPQDSIISVLATDGCCTPLIPFDIVFVPNNPVPEPILLLLNEQDPSGAITFKTNAGPGEVWARFLWEPDPGSFELVTFFGCVL